MPTRQHAPASALELAIAELRAQLEANTTRLTEAVSILRGLALNDVLRCETVAIPAGGSISRHTTTPFASVGAWNLSGANPMTLNVGAAVGAASTTGIGVIPLAANVGIVWPLAGVDVTIYGTPGDLVLLTLWAAPQQPMISR